MSLSDLRDALSLSHSSEPGSAFPAFCRAPTLLFPRVLQVNELLGEERGRSVLGYLLVFVPLLCSLKTDSLKIRKFLCCPAPQYDLSIFLEESQKWFQGTIKPLKRKVKLAVFRHSLH